MINYLPKKLFVSCVALLSLQTGCASITRGTSDALVVNSEPSQAIVKVFRTNGDFTKSELSKNNVGSEAVASAEKADADAPRAYLTAKTPASFQLARKGEYKLIISKSGYQEAEVVIGNRVSSAGGAGMAGNVLLGGLIGAGVDASTGAMKDLTPNPVQISLTADEEAVATAED